MVVHLISQLRFKILKRKAALPTLSPSTLTHTINQDLDYLKPRSSIGSPSSTSGLKPKIHEAHLSNKRDEICGRIICLRTFIG